MSGQQHPLCPALPCSGPLCLQRACLCAGDRAGVGSTARHGTQRLHEAAACSAMHRSARVAHTLESPPESPSRPLQRDSAPGGYRQRRGRALHRRLAAAGVHAHPRRLADGGLCPVGRAGGQHGAVLGHQLCGLLPAPSHHRRCIACTHYLQPWIDSHTHACMLARSAARRGTPGPHVSTTVHVFEQMAPSAHAALPPAACAAGSLGYGALGQLLWAQKLYMTGLLGAPQLPAVYRTVASAFEWAAFQVRWGGAAALRCAVQWSGGGSDCGAAPPQADTGVLIKHCRQGRGKGVQAAALQVVSAEGEGLP